MSHTDAQEAAGSERASRSIRNPRRRARPDSESIKVAPRRKRSKITETTFLPREEAPEGDEDESRTNGHAKHPSSRQHTVRKTSGSSLPGSLDIPVRGRQTAKRFPRPEGASTLTQNDTYSIKVLPSTPKELRRDDVTFRGSIDTQNSLALAVTSEKAYIWDYTGHGGTSTTKVVDVPSELSADLALPFGALVTGSTGSDLGLVLVAAQSGSVVYYESVSRVTSHSFFADRRDGVAGTIQGLFSGERVIQFSSAHPVGFVVLLNSGRVLHLSLRDPQGKPKIRSQNLYAHDQSAGGLFGSLKNILGSASWKQTISAVRTRTIDKGQVQVLGLLERGELRIWDIDWSGQYECRTSVDFREQLQSELRQMRTAEFQSHVDHLCLLDFAISDRSQHISGQVLDSVANDRPIEATMLLRCGVRGDVSFYIGQLSFSGAKVSVRRILTINSNDHSDPPEYRPRLLVPAPGNTAIVVRSTTITLVSLLLAASDPEAQLHEASYIEPEPYQDTIYLRKQANNIFLGGEADVNRSNGDSSALLFVQGAGVLKAYTHPISQDLRPFETVKTRLEQAVFFGAQEGNILDLFRPSDRSFPLEDIEKAALELSTEIFTSSSRFLDVPPVSVGSSLVSRAASLHAIAQILRRSYPPLSSSTTWVLLTQAEKLAASIRMWALYERSVANNKTKRVANLWHEILQCIESKKAFKSVYDQSGPDDLVRTLFVTQLDRLPDVLEFACRIVTSIGCRETDATPETAIRIASEADDIWLESMQTVFEFRSANAALYGLNPLEVDEGIITQPASLRGVDELWTSSAGLLGQVSKMVEEARQTAADSYETDPDASVERFVMKIAEENARLIEVSCLMYRERIAWCMSRETQKYSDQAEKLQRAYKITRHNQIRALAQIGQVQSGLKLAEKYKDMGTLTEMIVAETQYLFENRIGAPQPERQAIDAELEKNNKRVSKYFDTYGDEWSEAFFGHSFAGGTAGHMLTQAQTRWHGPLTKYLRKDPMRGKVCWINDVLQEKDYEHAGEALRDVAITQEHNLWSKKVQLSLAKLSMYTSHEKNKSPKDTTSREIDKELLFFDVQERLYEHISHVTHHSLDAEAAIKDAMASFAKGIQYSPLHHALLGALISRVLEHKSLTLEEVIDVLTLVDASVFNREEQDVERSETYEALTALYTAPRTSSAQFDLLLKLIWKRALLQENWEQLNNVALQDGDAAAREYVVQTNIYRAIHGILSKRDSSEEQIQILQPEQTLGAGCFVGDLPAYVPADTTDQYLEENIKMEREIESLIKEQRVSSWVATIERYAKDAIWAAAEERDANLSWSDEATNLVNGHGTNGTANGIKTEDHDEDDDASHLDDPMEDSLVL